MQLPSRYVRLGVDVGDARVGVAKSDPDGMLATPVDTFQREYAPEDVADVVDEFGAQVVIVGLPRHLNGNLGAAAQKVYDFCDELIEVLEAGPHRPQIRLVDERLTTVAAHQALHRSGKKEKTHRKVVDQVAAVMILQTALDQERGTGSLSGTLYYPHD